MNKAELVERAKVDPVAFREETARALDCVWFDVSARCVRLGEDHHLSSIRRALCDIGATQNDRGRYVVAYVEALAEALGVIL